jgi:subtilisin
MEPAHVNSLLGTNVDVSRGEAESQKKWVCLREAEQALREGTGAGVRIAIVDSGVEVAHPDLSGMQLTDDVAVESDGLQLHTVAGRGVDAFGHGTAVAGILRAVAPAADLGSFRVLGTNLRSRTAVICEGARQAVQRGYRILNCSFGCTRPEQVLAYKDWLDEAYVAQCHVVAAANNQDFSRREWPAHFTSVLGVSFLRSSEGAELFRREASLIEFAAPGEEVEVAWLGGGKRRVTGSSFATPVVTGLLARLLSVHPELTPLEAKALLRRLARPLPKTG